MKKKLYLLGVMFICCFISVPFLEAQNENDKSEQVLTKVIFVEGWDLSSFKDVKPVKEKTSTILNQTVSIETYKLPKPIETRLNIYALNGSKALVFDTINARFSGGTSYSVNGSIFGYKIIYGLFNISENGEKVITAGPPIMYYYCDEDGDGKFETRYTMNGDPKEIPSWVTKNKQ
jgi:hypothetical protein